MRQELDLVTVPIGLVLDNGNTAKEARAKGITLPADIPDHAVYIDSGFNWMALDLNRVTQSLLPLKPDDRVKVLTSTFEDPPPSRDPVGDTGIVRHINPKDGTVYVWFPFAGAYLWFHRRDLELVPT